MIARAARRRPGDMSGEASEEGSADSMRLDRPLPGLAPVILNNVRGEGGSAPRAGPAASPAPPSVTSILAPEAEQPLIRNHRRLGVARCLPRGISSWYVRAPRACTRWPGLRRATPELEVARVERPLMDAQRPRRLGAADNDVGNIGCGHPAAGRELGIDLGVLRPEPGFTPVSHRRPAPRDRATLPLPRGRGTHGPPAPARRGPHTSAASRKTYLGP